jgi:tripartite-type tricarboxylate transporter receptor subunit TctC
MHLQLSYGHICRIALGVVFALWGTASGVTAQEYPSRAISIVVPFPPGASGDIIARILANRMQVTLGQPVIVENVVGAGGTLGINRVVRAEPDGYTALIGNWSSNVGAPAIYPVTFNVLTDLQPVSRLTDVPLMLIGRKSLAPKTLAELTLWLRQSGNSATVATIGIGSASQLCAIDLQNTTKTTVKMVPYRGGAAAIQDVLGEQVDVMCGEGSGMLPHVRAKTVTPYAVIQTKRWFAAPDIPTTAEMGLPNFDLVFWHGLWLPRRTPLAIVAKMNAAVREAFSHPPTLQSIRDAGQELPAVEQQSPEGLAAYYKSSTERWWPVIKAANLRPEQ